MVGVLLGIPLFLTYERFFGVPRTVLILALMGFYGVLFQIKPNSIPIWGVWVAVFLFVAWLRWVREGHREPVWDPLGSWSVVAVLVVGFSLFAFRWEPPRNRGH